MNWLAWSLAGALIVTLWFAVMVLAAFSGSESSFVAICVFFGAALLAWLALGIAGAFGVYPRLTWGSL